MRRRVVVISVLASVILAQPAGAWPYKNPFRTNTAAPATATPAPSSLPPTTVPEPTPDPCSGAASWWNETKVRLDKLAKASYDIDIILSRLALGQRDSTVGGVAATLRDRMANLAAEQSASTPPPAARTLNTSIADMFLAWSAVFGRAYSILYGANPQLATALQDDFQDDWATATEATTETSDLVDRFLEQCHIAEG